MARWRIGAFGRPRRECSKPFELLLQISDAGFDVGLLCAAFFAPRDDGIERLPHTTKISRRLCLCLLALQPPRRAHAIPKEKSPKATHRALELLPVIRVGHRRPPRGIRSSLRISSRRRPRQDALRSSVDDRVGHLGRPRLRHGQERYPSGELPADRGAGTGHGRAERAHPSGERATSWTVPTIVAPIRVDR